ncbi:hypothetical protein Tco_1045210 [Tanacetum coccineum]|uniref:Uncharacterized protein n=1 Tax=Tanacetum coccineum TaxID=301880 RepID=A0ABQ5GS73_9ASTR
MEFESAQSSTTAKLPILKLGEYDMWVIRIKQYFQIQDYALWEVIENGNSWVSYNDAKTMFAAIKTRFRGNEATKKTQKTLLKLQYEYFSASRAESLDSNRLQKIVSKLEILGTDISKSTRKQSKTDTRTEECTIAGLSSQCQEKSKPQSILVNKSQLQ